MGLDLSGILGNFDNLGYCISSSIKDNVYPECN